MRQRCLCRKAADLTIEEARTSSKPPASKPHLQWAAAALGQSTCKQREYSTPAAGTITLALTCGTETVPIFRGSERLAQLPSNLDWRAFWYLKASGIRELLELALSRILRGKSHLHPLIASFTCFWPGQPPPQHRRRIFTTKTAAPRPTHQRLLDILTNVRRFEPRYSARNTEPAVECWPR